MKQTNQSKPGFLDALGFAFLITLLFIEPTKQNTTKTSLNPILIILSIILCCITYYVGYTSGCDITGTQAKLYEAIIDQSRLKSGLPHTIEIAATNEESARKIAIEQGMPRGGFSLRPKVNNYLTIRHIQLCP